MATYPIKWLGWGRYTNTGGRFRKWVLTEAVPEIKASKGDEIHDLGLQEGKSRFALVGYDSMQNQIWSYPDEAVLVDVIFDGVPPEWEPPVETAESHNNHVVGMELAASINRLILALSTSEPLKKAEESERECDKPHPRGVYVFQGEGQWGRDVIAAFDSRQRRIACRDIGSGDTPEEVACYASQLQTELDKKDPPPAPTDDAAAVEALLSGGGQTIREARGRELLRKADIFKSYRLDDWQKRKVRECGECGTPYNPDKRNTLRCRSCIEASKSSR